MRCTDPAHLPYARNKDFKFACSPGLFSGEEYDLIIRWGHWFKALAMGTIQPISDAQQKFIAAVKGDINPEEFHALAWWRYCKRLALEEKNGDAMHGTYQVEQDTFHNREGSKKLKRAVFSVVSKEHRRG